MVFGLNGGRQKLLDDPVEKESDVNPHQHDKEQRKSSSREGKIATGWFVGRSKEGTTKKEVAKSNMSSLQVNSLYAMQNAVKIKKPLYLVDSVPIPRLPPGEKMPYLLPPRGDDASTESDDDVSFRLPDLDCTTDCTTSDRQTNTDPSPDKSSFETLESTPEAMEESLNVSMFTTAAHLDFDTYQSSYPTMMDNHYKINAFTFSTDDQVEERRDSLENSEILIQLSISQVNSDLSDPNTNSSPEESASDSADDSSESAPCKLNCRRRSRGNIAMPDNTKTGLKHESLPTLYLGPLSFEEGMEDAIQKTTKDTIIYGALRINMLQSEEREGGDVILESLHSTCDDSYYATTIPFKPCKSGYISVVDPTVQISNDDQEDSSIIMKRFLQAGRIIQGLNYSLSLLNSISTQNSKDLSMILRNASTLQMILGRFNDSSELLKRVSLYDQEENQQSITSMMLGISMYGGGNFDESEQAFERALWYLRFEMHNESTHPGSKILIIHSYVKTLNNIACCSFHQGNAKKSIKALSIALGFILELLEKGTVHEQFDTSLSVDAYQIPEFSSDSLEQLPAALKYTLSIILCNIAYAFGKVEDFSLSSIYFNKALKIQRRLPCYKHLFTVSIDIMDSLAYCLRKMDRLNSAIRLYKNILKTKREFFRSEVQYRRCHANASSFCQALQSIKASSIEI